ncbi:MAG TPA: chromate efflux transporter [Xanthomonadales bacterium]|nr:chromate efflux transporter [Xanthomonadales bacterium]
MASAEPRTAPTFAEALRFWTLLGWISFGGPAGQVAIMHAELVERRRWVDDRRFADGLGVCMLLPGPEAQQLATWLGWTLHGVRGGLAAGILFVLPSTLLLFALSAIYVAWGTVPTVGGAIEGLKVAVLVLLGSAVVRLARKFLHGPVHLALAFGAGVAIALGAPFPAILVVAAVAGFASSRARPAPPSAPVPTPARNARACHATALALCVAWVLPVAAVVATTGMESTLSQVAVFFSRAALVTFGGAYAVLPYVSQHAVASGWLQPEQVLVGLGLAETTPGPLIIVLEFVGFVAGWQRPDAIGPVATASLAAALTVWATFVPSLMLVFAVAPHAERLARSPVLRGPLAGITAAVVGVVAELGVVFARGTLLPRDAIAWPLLALLAALSLLAWRVRLSVPVLVALGAAGGVALRIAGLA